MKKIWLIMLMLLTAGFLPGCAQKQQIEVEPKCFSGIDNETAMKTAQRVLVGMNFVIDKADPNLSIITTRPLSGGQFFELWRKDNVGGYNTAMSNVHSIQRTVELGLNETQGEVCIVCKVKIERLSIPEKEIDSAGRAYTMFSSSSELDQRFSLNPEQQEKMDWIDLGRDNRLEVSILNRIEKQIIKNAAKAKKNESH